MAWAVPRPECAAADVLIDAPQKRPPPTLSLIFTLTLTLTLGLTLTLTLITNLT